MASSSCVRGIIGRVATLATILLAASPVAAQETPARTTPPGEVRNRLAALIEHVEVTFPQWYERIAGTGGDAVYGLGQDKDHARMFDSTTVLGKVTETQDINIRLPGRLFIVAEFSMDDKPDYDLKRLYSVGGLYPAVMRHGQWAPLPVDTGGFMINQAVGGREWRPPFGQFTFKGNAGDRQIRVSGKGLAVVEGKCRLKIMSAMANDWAAHFPSKATINVYFLPNEGNEPGQVESVAPVPTPAATPTPTPTPTSFPAPVPSPTPAALPVPPATQPAVQPIHVATPIPDEPAPADCEIAIPSIRSTAGGSVRVAITLANASKTALGDINLTIHYPGKLLQLVRDAARGPVLDNAIFFAKSQPDHINVAIAEAGGLTRSGTLCYVDFRVIGPPGQKATLSVEVTSATRITDDRKVPFRTTAGQVSIEGVCGDAAGDGHITARDALLALQLSTKPKEERMRDPLLAVLDINGDGDVTSQDARWLLQLAVGVRPAGYTGPLGQPAKPADESPSADETRTDPSDAYAAYVTAFDELMDMLAGTDIDRPAALHQAQDALRQADKAYQASSTQAAYQACSAARDKLAELVGKVAIEAPAALAAAQQKFWSASRTYQKIKAPNKAH